MKAMILAAGRGERMRPLTDTRPKPLLDVDGRALIEWHIEALKEAGIKDILINTSWLGEQIPEYLGDGAYWGVNLTFSHEVKALETAGGIRKALDFFGDEPFIAVNGDIWTDFDYKGLLKQPAKLAHIVLVPNPEHNNDGDFAINDAGTVSDRGEERLTFSGIGVYDPKVFIGLPNNQAYPLAPLLKQLMIYETVTGEIFDGRWYDIGTPERLAELNQTFQKRITTIDYDGEQ